MITDTVNLHKGLTITEINTQFGNDYDMSRANKYLIGYRSNTETFDVKVGKGSILICYLDSPWKLPITSADLINKTPCTHCGGDGIDPDQSTATPMHLENNDPVVCTKCYGSCIMQDPFSDHDLD